MNGRTDRYLSALRRRVVALPRPLKRLVMVCADGACITASLLFALLVTYPTWFMEPSPPWAAFPLGIVVSVPVFRFFGLYRAVVRFIRSQAIFAVVAAVTGTSMLIALAGFAWEPTRLPLQTLVVFWAFAVLMVGGTRFTVRDFLHHNSRSVENVIIYGAGMAGARLASAMASADEAVPVAFLDDSRALQGSVVAGVPVFAPAQLPQLVSNFAVQRVLLAIPSASRRRRRLILRRLEEFPIHVQTVPDISDLVSGRARVDDLKEVDVDDLLGRDAVPPRPELFRACIAHKSVMITGAGGSIGSELCRQILRQDPTRLLLFERSEVALYNIERELRRVAERHGLKVELVPILGSVGERNDIERALKAFSVKTVYHAAAYKHVPLVEYNMTAGIRNNVFGTLNAALAAEATGVDTFVLISTDKAVNPTNVMGASKRLAEMVLQGIEERGTSMRICMVRFGNVLESSGSVVPLFREQIRAGGPVTVTHPDIVRYFMTIPEAAQLVIQAGAMSEGGEVFLLDMGEPVKIDDLARKMIRLMGLEVRDERNPDGDIEIRYTGLRPAEKLYEELLISGNATGTEHERIWRARENSVAWPVIQSALQALGRAARESDCRAIRRILRETVAQYTPPGGLVDKVWRATHVPPAARGASVVELPNRLAAPSKPEGKP